MVLLTGLFVVDAGVLFSLWPQKNPQKSLATTQAVVDEVLNRPSRRRIDELLSTSRLRVEGAVPSAFPHVEETARKTGDLNKLSKQDVELLALAISLSQESRDVTVVSTDLAVLNTAVSLGLRAVDPERRFRERIKWMFKCPACGKALRTAPPGMECPVCGTKMQRRPGQRKRVS
ncbi:NOB1 family endonuclease [Candidatus Thorarchaeota archaeon]|nr:MAG: NOB1 family endonuclease [Candidatus Thorarchaeota archaeon]